MGCKSAVDRSIDLSASKPYIPMDLFHIFHMMENTTGGLLQITVL
ncbi:hypothetical protein [Longirhabdus pacifica]|nr:hypothetical protein [Longirhabdus pacifica]